VQFYLQGQLFIYRGTLKTKTMKRIKKQNKNNSILMSDGCKFSKLTYLIAKKISFSGNFIAIDGSNYYQHDKSATVDFDVFSTPCATNFDRDLELDQFIAA
jgi:hypothetical protein